MGLRSALDGDVGYSKLGLEPIAYRVDNGDPRDSCCVNGFRGREGTSTTGKPRPKVVETGRDLHLYKRGDWTGIRRSARNRVWDVGSGVFVAWRSRLAHRRLAVFRRLDEHARRLRSDAATTLADDGCSGSIRRDSAIWCERGVYFRSHAGVLVNACRACDPQQKLTQEDPIVHSLSRQLSNCSRRRSRSSITTFSRCDDLALL